MERAQPDLAGGVVERQRLVRVRVEPQRRFDGAAAIARRRRRAGEGAIADQCDEARGQRHAGLVDADVAVAVGGSLRELAQHQQLGQGREAA